MRVWAVGRGSVHDLIRHRWLALALYAVQWALSAAVGFIVAIALGSAFARRPLFDEAVAGDGLFAVFATLRAEPFLIASLICTMLMAAAVYGALSWFLKGGLIAVLLDSGSSSERVATARRFGAGGAATFWAYVRLALWSCIPYSVVAVVLGLGLGPAIAGLAQQMDMAEASRGILLAAVPGLLLGLVVRTAMDYARIDLSRHTDLAAWRALLRSFRFVMTHPAALLHWLAYAALVLGATAGYLALARHQPMAGAAGAGFWFLLRQLVSSIRFALHVLLIAGQARLSH